MADSLLVTTRVEGYDTTTYQPILDVDISAAVSLSQNVSRQRKYQVSSSITDESISLGDIDSATGFLVHSDAAVTLKFNGSAAAAALPVSAGGWILFKGATIGSCYVTNASATAVANLDITFWK